MTDYGNQCEAPQPQPRLSSQADEAEGIATECETILRRLGKMCDRLRGSTPTPIGEKSDAKLPAPAHLIRLDQAHARSQSAQRAISELLSELEGMI